MPDDLAAANPAETTPAFIELKSNLDYARDLVRGGRLLQRLRVGAFDVSDLYRAAWVQAVSALDHWVHQELYDRALAFASEVSEKRPAKYLRVAVPMSLLEDVVHHSKTIEDVFRSHLRSQYAHQSFQHPEKIKEAIAVISEVSLWPGVAKRLTNDGVPSDPKSVQDTLIEIVKRRNRIAHETDRDHQLGGTRASISDTEALETIDWLERIAGAIAGVVGPPPAGAPSTASVAKKPTAKWTRKHVDSAVMPLVGTPAGTALQRLLAHADAHHANWNAGTSAEPSGGAYYKVRNSRRSLWSLYLTEERPVITVNLSAIRSYAGEALVYRMVEVLRGHPTLDAALLYDDAKVIRKYPAFELATLGESADVVDTVIQALDLVASPSKPTSSTGSDH